MVDILEFETLFSWLELLLDAQYANFIVSKDDLTIGLLGQCSLLRDFVWNLCFNQFVSHNIAAH